jgi:protein TonB
VKIDWRDPDGRPLRRITPLAAARWTAAITLVTVAHAGGAWMALNWKPAPETAGEPPPAVMIELAPLAVSPEAPPEDVAPGPQMTEAEVEPTPREPEKPVEKPDDVPEPVEQETVEKPIEKLPEKPNAQAVLSPVPEKPKPEPVKKPPPKPKPIEKKKPRDPKKHRAPQTTAPQTSQAQRAATAAAPFASSSQTPSMSPASWRGSLMAHLNRYKRFPSGAAGIGTVTVAFTIDRSGRVLSSRLVRGSGDAALDAEAVSLPRRASPVPAPPPNVGGGSVTLAVPIRFNR